MGGVETPVPDVVVTAWCPCAVGKDFWMMSASCKIRCEMSGKLDRDRGRVLFTWFSWVIHGQNCVPRGNILVPDLLVFSLLFSCLARGYRSAVCRMLQIVVGLRQQSVYRAIQFFWPCGNRFFFSLLDLLDPEPSDHRRTKVCVFPLSRATKPNYMPTVKILPLFGRGGHTCTVALRGWMLS